MHDIVLLKALSAPVIGRCVFKLESLPRHRDRNTIGIQLLAGTEIDIHTGWRGGDFAIFAYLDRSGALPGDRDYFRNFAFNGFDGVNGGRELNQWHLSALLVDDMGDGARERYQAGALPEIAAVAGQFKRTAARFATKHIFGDKEHAVELGGHVHFGKFASVVNYRGIHHRVREAEEFVVQLLRGGFFVEGILVYCRLILPGGVGEGVFECGGKVLKVIRRRKGYIW